MLALEVDPAVDAEAADAAVVAVVAGSAGKGVEGAGEADAARSFLASDSLWSALRGASIESSA